MSFDIASVSTVWQLKKLVKRSIDVPKRQQRLLNGARELTNHSPLNCSQRLTLVIVDTTCQVCDAETSAPRICGGTVAKRVSAMIGRDTGTSELFTREQLCLRDAVRRTIDVEWMRNR